MTKMNHIAREASPEARKVLFVCTMNRWRGPTAEKLYERQDGLSVRSRGTSRKSVRPLALSDLIWADTVFVMEQKHLSYLLTRFSSAIGHTEIQVLDVPDAYQFMAPELVEELRLAIDSVLMPDGRD